MNDTLVSVSPMHCNMLVDCVERVWDVEKYDVKLLVTLHCTWKTENLVFWFGE